MCSFTRTFYPREKLMTKKRFTFRARPDKPSYIVLKAIGKGQEIWLDVCHWNLSHLLIYAGRPRAAASGTVLPDEARQHA
jgi:hypothetical protein